MLPDIADYQKLCASFQWSVPARFNIGVAVSDVWAVADPDRPAILDLRGGALETLTFGALAERSNRLAHALSLAGVARGDRVAILLPQMAEVVVAHVAIYKLGAVALPLASLFGVWRRWRPSAPICRNWICWSRPMGLTARRSASRRWWSAAPRLFSPQTRGLMTPP